MINVIIAGAAGRMGQRVALMVNSHPQLNYSAAFEAAGSPAIGKDAGLLSAGEENGVIISEGLESVIDRGDVIIDFTFHKATIEFARLAARHNKAMVIGTGLGLSIVHSIVKELNGDITCNTVEGKGTDFIITLPVSSSKRRNK